MQAFRKVTNGTPCDTQLATYLLEADIVLSSDGGFVDRIEECRKYAVRSTYCRAPAPATTPKCLRPNQARRASLTVGGRMSGPLTGSSNCWSLSILPEM